MDTLKIVENIQRICKQRGITPTIAGRDSGAGKTLVSNLKHKGTMPSIEKFQLLAIYLGCTTSELLGETERDCNIVDDETSELLVRFSQLNDEGRERLLETADDMVRSGKYSKKSSQPGLGSKEA